MQCGVNPHVTTISYMPRTIIIKARLHFVFKKTCKYLYFEKFKDTEAKTVETM